MFAGSPGARLCKQELYGIHRPISVSRSIRDLVRWFCEVCIDWSETLEIEGTNERPSLRVSISVSVST